METKKRFRPNLRQYRILEEANKELVTLNNKWFYDNLELTNRAYKYKKNGDRAIRLNWLMLALIFSLNICLIWR